MFPLGKSRTKAVHRARPRGRKRLVAGVLAGFGLIAWAAGYVSFARNLPDTPERPGARTDAIVVLTGGSLRLEEGLALLAAGRGRKLFVSGVHRGVDVEELLTYSATRPEDVACCIALGYDADNTVGNARETAEWMRAQGYRSLRLVTAGYHMPRGLLEFRAAMPDVAILAHPVMPDRVKTEAWWRYPGTAMLIAEEYTKTVIARAAHGLRALVS